MPILLFLFSFYCCSFRSTNEVKRSTRRFLSIYSWFSCSTISMRCSGRSGAIVLITLLILISIEQLASSGSFRNIHLILYTSVAHRLRFIITQLDGHPGYSCCSFISNTHFSRVNFSRMTHDSTKTLLFSMKAESRLIS